MGNWLAKEQPYNYHSASEATLNSVANLITSILTTLITQSTQNKALPSRGYILWDILDINNEGRHFRFSTGNTKIEKDKWNSISKIIIENIKISGENVLNAAFCLLCAMDAPQDPSSRSERLETSYVEYAQRIWYQLKLFERCSSKHWAISRSHNFVILLKLIRSHVTGLL